MDLKNNSCFFHNKLNFSLRNFFASPESTNTDLVSLSTADFIIEKGAHLF